MNTTVNENMNEVYHGRFNPRGYHWFIKFPERSKKWPSEHLVGPLKSEYKEAVE